MEILNSPIQNRPAAVSTSSPPRTNHSASFGDLLTGYVDKTKPQQPKTAPAEPIILVGKITSETQTVSELLMQHKELKKSTWNILDKKQNKNRDFTRIQPGTPIYYNTEKGILTWSTSPLAPSPPTETLASTRPHPTGDPSTQNSKKNTPPGKTNPVHPADINVAPAATMTKAYSTNKAQHFSPGNESSIGLGRLDRTNTTVSHLLINHPQLRKDAWNLLSSSVNRDKPFHRLARGTEIFLNTKNMEITWNSGETTLAVSRLAVLAAPETSRLNSAAQQPGSSPAANLSEAVKPYLGTPYKEMNCYELLVKGLQHMDIPYKGRDGLYTKLTRMAQDRGMAENAYLTGEGIIEAAGSLVLSKNYPDIVNWKDQAAALMREIEPHLNSGQILSFSTDTKGHTGIVSQQKDQWTFINSGRLDNSVESNSVYRGVGEEVLNKEIRNWFKLAHAKKETLNVTLGRLEQNIILTASTISESSLKPI